MKTADKMLTLFQKKISIYPLTSEQLFQDLPSVAQKNSNCRYLQNRTVSQTCNRSTH